MRRNRAQILAEIRTIKTNPDNYIEEVIRADPYTLIAERMIEKVPNSEVFAGMSFSEVRAYCKQPLMTALYNSVMEPIKAFGEDTEELAVFYTSLEELFPGAINVMKALNARWDNTALFHNWRTPDGHEAYVEVIQHIEGVLSSEGLNLPYRFSKNMPSDIGTALSPNYIHSLDAYCVRYVRDNVDFDFVHIHDDYQAHPNNMGRVRELYLEALKNIAEGGYLEEFCGQDFGIDTKDFVEGLKDSSYALC